MANLFKRMNRKEDPSVYEKKDSEMVRSLTTKDFLALGVGTIVSTAIFTLPGIVAAHNAGPAVTISFLLAAVVAGLVALSYAEMASAMPFAGSAYSWINVIFGEFWGWVAGWALLAEYFIAVSFVAAGLSANFRGLIEPLGIHFPTYLANPISTKGGLIDICTVAIILIVMFLITRGDKQTSKIENILVILKVLAVLVFIVVGATAIHLGNYVPFIPAHHVNADGTNFGGFSGIYAGVSVIFLSYIGFDSIAANSAEAKNPQKTMPRGIIGSLVIAVTLFVAVSLVLVGMFKYTNYANNAEPVGWALRQAGHPLVASGVQIIAVVGMFTALIGMMMAGSRLIYSFGRDGMLPKFLGKVDKARRLPLNAIITITVISVLIGALLTFNFLSQLISAGTLIAFMFVSLGVYPLRKREGEDISVPGFKEPLYPIMPALGFLASLWVFWGLDNDAKLYALVWFIIGMIIYFAYGMKHRADSQKAETKDNEDF